MEQFLQDHIKRSRKTFLDRYQIQLQASKNKVVTIEGLNLTEYSTTKEALQFYFRGAAIIVVGLATSAITYPLAVRIAKRLGLRDFLNIHMAVIPMVINANALTLGMTQGYINYHLLIRKYPLRPDSPQMAIL